MYALFGIDKQTNNGINVRMWIEEKKNDYKWSKKLNLQYNFLCGFVNCVYGLLFYSIYWELTEPRLVYRMSDVSYALYVQCIQSTSSIYNAMCVCVCLMFMYVSPKIDDKKSCIFVTSILQISMRSNFLKFFCYSCVFAFLSIFLLLLLQSAWIESFA